MQPSKFLGIFICGQFFLSQIKILLKVGFIFLIPLSIFNCICKSLNLIVDVIRELQCKILLFHSHLVVKLKKIRVTWCVGLDFRSLRLKTNCRSGLRWLQFLQNSSGCWIVQNICTRIVLDWYCWLFIFYFIYFLLLFIVVQFGPNCTQAQLLGLTHRSDATCVK